MGETLAGIAFPFRVLGAVQVNRDAAKIADDVRHLLSTRLGERVMLRSYGGGAHHRLPEANDSTIRALIKHEIQEGLRAFMPDRSEEHTSELQSQSNLVCRLLLEKKKKQDDKLDF